MLSISQWQIHKLEKRQILYIDHKPLNSEETSGKVFIYGKGPSLRRADFQTSEIFTLIDFSCSVPSGYVTSRKRSVLCFYRHLIFLGITFSQFGVTTQTTCLLQSFICFTFLDCCCQRGNNKLQLQHPQYCNFCVFHLICIWRWLISFIIELYRLLCIHWLWIVAGKFH